MFEKTEKGMWWDEGSKLVEGCSKIGKSCENCWSLEMEKRFGGDGVVKIFPKRLEKIMKRKKPTVFSIWNDLFHPAVPEKFIDKVYGMMLANPRHLFIVLTKRPERMLKYYNTVIETSAQVGEPALIDRALNIVIGTSAGTQIELDMRSDLLKLIPVHRKMKMLSIEPLLEQISLNLYENRPQGEKIARPVNGGGFTGKSIGGDIREVPGFGWVIVGCESGEKKRKCDLRWIENVVMQCQRARVDVFVKQINVNGYVVKDLDKFPGLGLRFREIPNYLEHKYEW